MQNKARIMVFPAGTEIGLEIYRSLQHSKHFDVVGGSSAADHAQFVFKENYVGDFPYVADPGFVDFVAWQCEQMDIDYIYPAHDDVLYQLAKHRDRIPAEIIAPDFETVEVCRFKSKTYATFPQISPRVYRIAEMPSLYPVFVKPDNGQGSRGAHKVESAEQWSMYNLNSGNITTEYLPGAEYTTDCFTDKDGNLRFFESRVRNRIKGGISVNTIRVKHRKLAKMAQDINTSLKMRGAWFFQTKEDVGHEPVLMEIAARPAGSSGIWRACGVNLVELSVWDRMGKDVDFVVNYFDIQMDRALASRYKFDYDIKRIYCDFDDCLLFDDNRLNGPLYSFLIENYRKGKEVVMISRDASRYEGLNMPFPIIRIPDRTIGKSTEINPDGAIFIDDSFAERREVYRAHGIPVFGLDAVEALL